MISPALLFSMYDVAEATARECAGGDLVECGVWNGGSAALLAEAAGVRSGGRACWLFDSFQGLPEPTERDPEEIRRYWFRGWNAGDPALVAGIWDRLGLPSEALRIREGWFHETFEEAPIRSIAILHVDADWYEPVMLCLEAWYGKVVPGGAVILNDYGLWEGATRAVDEFIRERGLQVEVRSLGRVGAWFRKPA
jgi:O-methyltransferase